MNDTAAVNIRAVELIEAPQLGALARQTYQATWGDEMSPDHLAHIYATELSDAHFAHLLQFEFALVAVQNAHWLGYVHFGDYPASAATPDAAEDAGEIHRLYVHPDRHNGGLGGQLLRAALDHPRMHVRAEVYLHVWETNFGAQRLYQRYGFFPVGRRPEYNPQGQHTGDDIIMCRRQQSSAAPG